MDLKQIKQARKDKGLSISEVSRITGISRNTISAIEQDQTNPTFKNVIDILNAIGHELILKPKQDDTQQKL